MDLDISDLRIRDIGTALSPENFPSLTDLRIAHNSLTSVHGLISLPQLTALNADGNRLGSGNPPLFGPQSAASASMMVLEGETDGDVAGADSVADVTACIDALGTKTLTRTPEPATPSGDTMEDVVLPRLQVLQLGDNRLLSIDMTGVSRLTSLRSLFLQNNQIVKVGGLSALSHLEELVRQQSKIVCTVLIIVTQANSSVIVRQIFQLGVLARAWHSLTQRPV